MNKRSKIISEAEQEPMIHAKRKGEKDSYDHIEKWKKRGDTNLDGIGKYGQKSRSGLKISC